MDWIVVINCAAAVDAAATILSLLLIAAALPLLTVTVAMAVDGGDSGHQQRWQQGARVTWAGADDGVRESVRPMRARG